MNKQRLVWWIIFITSLIALTGIFYFSLNIAANPEASAFVIGAIGFWLFGNRLIFGFGAITDTVNKFLKEEEIDKEKVAEKSNHQFHNLEQYTIPSLIMLWKGSLEPYRYTYYFAFFFALALDILFELQILIIPSVSTVIKAFMLGAAIPTLFVWALELMANYYIRRMLFEKC